MQEYLKMCASLVNRQGERLGAVFLEASFKSELHNSVIVEVLAFVLAGLLWHILINCLPKYLYA